MIVFLFKQLGFSAKRIRMWCVQQIVTTNRNLSTQQLCEEAEELYNYINEGIPYQAEWTKKKP